MNKKLVVRGWLGILPSGYQNTVVGAGHALPLHGVFSWLTAFIFLLCSFSAWASKPLPHDFHVSIITIDHNPQTQSLEITCKIFTDDLEKAIAAIGGQQLGLGEAQEHPKADEALFAYLQNRLQLVVNGQDVAFKWVGKEIELDATWMYIEVANIPTVTDLDVTCRILTELFGDQSNLVHVTVGGSRKSLFLRTELVKDHLSF